ncbi:XRE family transcriptional regulator [Streptomyces nitrosporeus]|uniref:XRE family transcriptional regulator n=1 Tax=Streptomyces nitrosporeus TaxID=28894 RepID=A0A5J6FEI1_9ACTN|nr:helix-turn-helix transcriptional regulator [Streptomyces nitrosporeus]QEU74217.1 XRE family transcriptional regulator [Streptomyces nitrosporeus]GGY97245.1 transcriptional regulator [Streptomyces nitrosporeus]
MGQTIRSRRLGSDLRQLRRRSDMTAEAVGSELGFSQSKMSRIESGDVRVSRTDLKALLALYEVTDEQQIAAFLEAAKDARSRGWWIAYEDALPREYRDFIALEGTATGIRTFEGMIVPGLMQTPEYTRHIITAGPAVLPPGHVDSLIKVRMERQSILDGEQPPKIWVIVTEGALRQVVGGHAVMLDQLHHLTRLAERSSITLQVLPFEAGAHAGVQSSFWLFDFPTDPSIACVANLTGTLFMDRPGQLKAFSDAFDNLRASALSPADSLRRVTDIMTLMRREQDQRNQT